MVKQDIRRAICRTEVHRTGWRCVGVQRGEDIGLTAGQVHRRVDAVVCRGAADGIRRPGGGRYTEIMPAAAYSINDADGSCRVTARLAHGSINKLDDMGCFIQPHLEVLRGAIAKRPLHVLPLHHKDTVRRVAQGDVADLSFPVIQGQIIPQRRQQGLAVGSVQVVGVGISRKAVHPYQTIDADIGSVIPGVIVSKGKRQGDRCHTVVRIAAKIKGGVSDLIANIIIHARHNAKGVQAGRGLGRGARQKRRQEQ